MPDSAPELTRFYRQYDDTRGKSGPPPRLLEFGLLGQLIVQGDGQTITVPGGKQRVVLAALLLRARKFVALDELASAVWGDMPPFSARVTLQNYIKRLRAVLGDRGRARLTTSPGGYSIAVGDGELDVTRFEGLQREAAQAAQRGQWDQAAERLRKALALWRGEPLSDVRSDLLLRERPRLEEMHLQAVEARIDADLHLGRHRQVIAELRQLARDHRLRERLHEMLMLALYRDGRQAEALAAYQQVWQVVVGELGVEPGHGLRHLHQRMLAADDALMQLPQPVTGYDAALLVRERPLSAARPMAAVPRQLPAVAGHFVGREADLARLSEWLDDARRRGVMLVAAIRGTAGVGKTALAVSWAHQVADRFPDGQLYVDLRGYAPDRPLPVADALARFLRALGETEQAIPQDCDERAARYRSLLAGRQVLVVLDNARDAKQARPLLPGEPGCGVVVTSRDSLAGLAVRDGAWSLELGLLAGEQAVVLLRQLIGGRVATDPAAAADLAGQCAHLPLALRAAAKLAATRSASPLAELVDELDDPQQRLHLLDAGGGPHTALRSAFWWSYRHLDTETARAFRLLGLHPAADFDRYAAAALAGLTAGEASSVLGLLGRAHLLQPTGPRRLGMHDLLRAYAAGLAADDGVSERRAAQKRLLDYYAHTAATATAILFPGEAPLRPPGPAPGTPAIPLADPVSARRWLDAERANLTAAIPHAARSGWTGHATCLQAAVLRYPDTDGHHPDPRSPPVVRVTLRR